MDNFVSDEVRCTFKLGVEFFVYVLVAHLRIDIIVHAGVYGRAAARIGECDDRIFLGVFDLNQRGRIFRDGATVGIGAGQMSRVDSSRIAARKAEDAAEAAGLGEPLTKGSVVASDAFFPFPDGLLAAIEAGATAVIQPGGSMRDDKVIAAADERGIAMVFTGVRHFRH